MNILEKEFTKYSKPIFFNFARIIIYLATLFILLGTFSRRNESQFIFINLFVLLAITIILISLDAYMGILKQKSYRNHKVQFFDDYILFVDHRGEFKIPYNEMTSYQLLSNQITIRVPGNRFVISGRLHGINIEELKTMVDFLHERKVISKSGYGFFFFILIFVIINYGSDYLFINVLQLSSDASLFGTLYLCIAIGVGYYTWEWISAGKFLIGDDKDV